MFEKTKSGCSRMGLVQKVEGRCGLEGVGVEKEERQSSER